MLNKYLQLNYPKNFFNGLDKSKIIEIFYAETLLLFYKSLKKGCKECKTKVWVVKYTMKFPINSFCMDNNSYVCVKCGSHKIKITGTKITFGKDIIKEFQLLAKKVDEMSKAEMVPSPPKEE